MPTQQMKPGAQVENAALGAANRSRGPMLAGMALALAALAAAIVFSLLQLRQHIFAQIAERDGRTLDAVATVQFADDKANDESITSLEDPSEQIQLAFKISERLSSVLGVRLFSPDGSFLTAVPPYITETRLSAEDLAELRKLQPVSHYVARAQLKEQDLLAETNGQSLPLLVVNIPLREEGSKRPAGIAQFLVHGSGIASQYALLDRRLAVQGILVFFISGSILIGGWLLAFARVHRANRLLAQRTENLLKANRELALAAKASAIGAVTSHLIHGLRNPLSGLRSFVQDRAQNHEDGQENDWQMAEATTARMQQLIERVVRVLQEQQTVVEYEITLAELLALLNARIGPLAEAASVQYLCELAAVATLSNRQADLLFLILENLLQNAVEATPAGRAVTLRIFQEADVIVMEIEDQGPGLSPALLDRLFSPCSSSKKGGSGIGLAISRQLATHLGAVLDLKRSSTAGCCFRLCLPRGELSPGAEANSSPGAAIGPEQVLVAAQTKTVL